MKRINELSEREILGLSDEDVKNLVKLELAYGGVKLVDKPIEPYKPKVEDDIKVYGIIGVDGLFFKDKTDAQYLSMVIKKGKMMRTSRDWNLDAIYIDEIKVNKDSNFESYDVVERFLPLKESVDKLSDRLKSYQEKHKEYVRLMDEYDKCKNEAVEISNNVHDIVNETRRKYERMKRLRKIYKNEYLPLAGGNDDLAMSFFEKAYDPDEETLDYILADDDLTDGEE